MSYEQYWVWRTPLCITWLLANDPGHGSAIAEYSSPDILDFLPDPNFSCARKPVGSCGVEEFADPSSRCSWAYGGVQAECKPCDPGQNWGWVNVEGVLARQYVFCLL